ncbi:MAG: NAD(P)-binding domain-containing protein [Polyangiaceae bacterium]|nr:NAD(P)-binding domain-containing protein [Polyangiaceae bacterium]
MRNVDTVVIGGGQAGLAMSRCLTERRVEHVVLERGRLAERWRSERWDSLMLLTPKWQSRLPGYRYTGPDPDGYATSAELVSLLEGYAGSFGPPLLTDTTVQAVTASGESLEVQTTRGAFRARAVVIATGHADVPRVPEFASRLPGHIVQVHPTRYKRPEQLPPGGVLVVGASATGVQLADELHRSGRPVTLSVGHHTRLPRVYRGRDILWWLDAMGVLRESKDQVRSLHAAREQPSMQLVGRPDRSTLDLGVLSDAGVALAGGTLGADADGVSFGSDLNAQLRRADDKLWRLLGRIDAFGRRAGLIAGQDETLRPEPIRAPSVAPRLHWKHSGIRTVLWATGYRRQYPWLRVGVLDAQGEIVHDGGVTPHPGLYVLGLPFLRRRNSSFLDGVGADATELAAAIAKYLGGPTSQAA